MRGAAVNVKRVALELGGKSPNIVFADADFETAVDNALTAAFTHSGQVCSAGCRAIVQDEIYDRFVDGGRPARRPDPARARHGRRDRDRRAHLRRAPGQGRGATSASAIAEGARLVAGGRRPDRARAPGRLLLPADGLRRLHARHADRPRGGLRAGPDRRAVHDRGRGDRARQRHDLRPGRRGLDRRRRAGPARRRHGSATARSGSTTTTPTCRRPSGAASSSRGSAGSWPERSRRVPRGQAHLAEHGTRSHRLVLRGVATPPGSIRTRGRARAAPGRSRSR